jgi:peptidoglycan hydrolase-like protein with peptidoglycan-binding domain
VLTLQIYLNRFNYRLNLDSIFGSATLWALKDFQLRNGLSITGTADEKTCAKLLLAPTSKTWYTGSRPETVVTASAAESFVNRKGLQSPTPFLLWIDTSIPRLYLFQGEAGQWTLLKNFAVTVGKPSTPTIKGTFSVKKKGLSFIVPDHEDWMCKYYTQFYGDYLMHSIVYDLEGHVVDGRLGKYLSKGCVRMATANAKYIYDNIPYGTTVYVN